jgi:hypothetical protein
MAIVGSPIQIENQIQSQFGRNNYFKAVQRDTPISFLTSTRQTVAKLSPLGDGLVDIVNRFQWKNSGSTNEVPTVVAEEYELDYGQWTQNLANLFNGISNIAQGGLDVYQTIYYGTPTGFKYSFPWLLTNGDTIRKINNTWDRTEGISDILMNAAGEAKKFTEVIGKMVGMGISYGSAGVGFEEINEYKSTASQELKIVFPLYNTTTIEKAYDNFTFVNLFTFQNLKTRTSIMTFVPPKLYKISSTSLGGLYMPVCYVQDFTVESIGTTRTISDYQGYGTSPLLIPEAYKISITFKELLPQSSNIFSGTMGGTPIEIIGNGLNEDIAQRNSRVDGTGLAIRQTITVPSDTVA